MRTYLTSTLLGSIAVILFFVGCAKSDEAAPPAAEANLSVVGVEPAKPANLSYTDLTARSIKIHWTTDNVNTDEIHIRLARVADGLVNGSYIFGTAATLYRNTSVSSDFNRRQTTIELQPSTLYRFRVRAQNNSGPVQAVSVQYIEFTSPAEQVTYSPPAIPVNFHGSDTTVTSLKLGWNTVSGVSYRIEKYGNGAYSFYANAIAPPLSVTGLAANTLYWFRIRAEQNGYASNWSEISVRTDPAPVSVPVPIIPTGLAETYRGPSSLSFQWDAGTAGSTYRVEKWNGSSWALLTNTQATAIGDTGLASSATFYYRLRAELNGMQSGYTQYITIQTLAAPVLASLGAPNMVSFLANSSSSITVGMSCPSGSGYSQSFVYLSLQSTGAFVQQKYSPSSATQAVFNNLTPGTSYLARVACQRASDNAWSVYSNPRNVNTLQ